MIRTNIDSGAQYAFTRSIAGYMLSRYDHVLKTDGEVGNRKSYAPRTWGKPDEAMDRRGVTLVGKTSPLSVLLAEG